MMRITKRISKTESLIPQALSTISIKFNIFGKPFHLATKKPAAFPKFQLVNLAFFPYFFGAINEFPAILRLFFCRFRSYKYVSNAVNSFNKSTFF